MIVPQVYVAASFSVVAIFCALDMMIAKAISVKVFRLFEGLIVSIAAWYYWEAFANNALPSQNLRFVWLALCIIMGAEIISRQSWGIKTK